MLPEILSSSIIFIKNKKSTISDAIKAYSHSDNINKDKQLLFLRAQCYLFLGNLPETQKNILKLIEMTTNKVYAFDRTILEALLLLQDQINFKEAFEKLHQLSNGKLKNGALFREHDLYLYKGVSKFFDSQYELAIKEF